MPDHILGIDLGTTNSVIAVLEGGRPHVIPSAEGTRLCPSIVCFPPDGSRPVGELARRQRLAYPERTIASIKRYMGTTHTVTIDERVYTPPEISAIILQKLHRDAEAYLDTAISQAVITVPAYFSDAQRQATRDAGRIAGLEVVRIINEPTAAALAYGQQHPELRTVLVWDLGGGTFDVSILTIEDGIFQVRATCGDSRLGGDDWDGRLMSFLIRSLQERSGVELAQNALNRSRMKDAAEEAKMRLSDHEVTTVLVPFLGASNGRQAHLRVALRRGEFEEFTADLRQRLLPPTTQALGDAGLTPDGLDAVILVGGSTRMPAVQQLARETLRREPLVTIGPDEVVALGAAIQGGMLSGALTGLELRDVTPLTLGIETAGGLFTPVIPRNTTIPTSGVRLFSTSRDGQETVDFHVLQGERELAKFNKSLGRFTLAGIPPAPRGEPRIAATFDIDANGIVHIAATDEATGASQAVVVTASSGLSEDEIQRMIAEADAHADADKDARQVAELRLQADGLISTVESYLQQHAEFIPDAERTGYAAAITDLRAAATAGDLAPLQQHLDALRDLNHTLTAYHLRVSDEE